MPVALVISRLNFYCSIYSKTMDFDTAFGYSILGCILSLFCIIGVTTIVALVRDCRDTGDDDAYHSSSQIV